MASIPPCQGGRTAAGVGTSMRGWAVAGMASQGVREGLGGGGHGAKGSVWKYDSAHSIEGEGVGGHAAFKDKPNHGAGERCGKGKGEV